MLPRDVHVAVDERQKIAPVRAPRVAKSDHGNVVAIVLFRNRTVISCQIPLRIKRQIAHAAGTGKFEIWVQKEGGFADTRCTNHEAMHIVTVDQRIELLAALCATENQSLHLRQILSCAP